MDELTQFVVRHGGLVLFATVFAEQAGLPIPVVPVLLAAGAPAARAQGQSLHDPGALRMAAEEVVRRRHEIPKDRDVILLCACPNEVASARMALQLKKSGITRVRPLAGGVEAWLAQNFPVQKLASSGMQGERHERELVSSQME